jgi:hypothetical protein
MNLKDLLLAEHSRKQCDRITAFIGDDKRRFAELMELFLSGEYRLTQRAAWPVSYCVRKYPELIRPYFKPLLDNLAKKNLHDAVIRNSVRLLQEITIPKKFQGQLMSICFEFIQSNETAIAIKAFSLTILRNMTRQYPEIIPELKLIIDERWEIESAAFRSKAKKILSL